MLLILGLSARAGAADYETVLALNEARMYGEAYQALVAAERSQSADPRLLRLLGDAYAQGRGVAVNPVKAVALYRRAALAGDGEAAVRLGGLYERGEGVPKSPRQAFEWYLKAADREAEAAFKVASGLLANPDAPVPDGAGDPIERLQFAAEQGHPEAQRLLGGLHLEGIRVPKDPALAAKWLEAAGGDSPENRRQLGILYAASSAPETRARGLNLLQQAFDTGDPIAAAYLGLYAERAALTTEHKRAALAYYAAAAPAAIDWAEAGRTRLEANLASLELLGLKMQGARRAELLRHLESRGSQPAASVRGVYDAFDSAALVPGSESLTVMYAPGAEQYVAELALRFAVESPAQGEETLARLKTRLTTSYGPNVATTERRIARWRVGEAEVTLKWAGATAKVMVVYRFQPYADQLARAIAESQDSAPPSGGGPG
jgi:TPR repeat protein